jgi:hypothetical protein
MKINNKVSFIARKKTKRSKISFQEEERLRVRSLRSQ